MFFLLFLSYSFGHPAEIPTRLLNLGSRLFQALAVHFSQRHIDPPASPLQDGGCHIQIARQRGGLGGGGRLRLALRFQKQLRRRENALAHHARAFAPSRVELFRLARIPALGGECGGHALAIVHADARHRRQILHGQLRRDLSLAHLLLDGFRQKFDQRQSTRYPTGTAVEAARQFVERIAVALLHFAQQPALLQVRFLLAHTQRPVQQQRVGFAHWPHHSLDRVAPQLLERGDALVAVDNHVAAGLVRRRYHDNGRLLAAFSQRRDQPPLPLRVADSQMFPAPVELVKFQLHRTC